MPPSRIRNVALLPISSPQRGRGLTPLSSSEASWLVDAFFRRASVSTALSTVFDADDDNADVRIHFIPSEVVMARICVDELELRESAAAGRAQTATVEGGEHLIHFICEWDTGDCAGASSMLPMADGLLVVIDDEDGGGIPLEAEEMLRRAVADRIKPVVIIDRLEKAIIDQSMSKDDLYAKMYANIESINDIISIFADETVRGDMTVCPIQGSVAFGSNLHGWAFTLHQFAARYSKKFGIDKDKMIARLWGDHFFDPATKAWTTRSTNNQGMQLERAFCMFVLDPVYKLVEAVNGGDKGALSALLEKLGVQLMPHEWDRTGRALVKTVLRRFLPATDTLLNMICVHLPSPSAAQLRRGEILYTGPQQDDAAMGIRTCDPDGPLMVYVAKMIPTAERGRFYALARVFSGTLRAGQSVRIQGSKYIPGKMDDLVVRKVQELFAIARSNDKVSIDTCPAGSIVAIAGIDKYLPVTGTLTASESSHSLRTVAPPTVNAFQVLVDVSLAGHLSRFMEDLKVLTRSDPYLRCDRLDSGEVKMATSSEGHLQRCLSSLSDTGVTLTVGEIHVPLRETVLAQSSIVCMAKSPNKHARVYMTAAPLGEALAKVIEEVNTKDRAPIAFQGDVAAKQTLSRSDAAATRESAVAIAIRHGWPSDDAHNIWCFAPDHRGANLLVDRRHLQPHASRTTPDPGDERTVREACVAAIQWSTQGGVLCEEPVHNVAFHLVDFVSAPVAPALRRSQLLPAARRAANAAFLAARPALLEPVVRIHIRCAADAAQDLAAAVDATMAVLRDAAATIDDAPAQDAPTLDADATDAVPPSQSSSQHPLPKSRPSRRRIHTVSATLPSNAAIGLAAALRTATVGHPAPLLFRCEFIEWRVVDDGDVLSASEEDGGRARALVVAARQRKYLKPKVPEMADFCDAL